MSGPILVRAGMPLTGGTLVEYAKRHRMPVLMSANAFAVRYPANHAYARTVKGFRKELGHLRGLDVALDSAGWCAASLYGSYPWTPDQYLDLAASHPWSFYSSMDYCLEPDIAGDRATRMIRMAETARLYGVCCAGAAKRGIKPPMPVLQGWTPAEYLTSMEWMPIGGEWPELVGVGSVCRRQLFGPNGLLAVLEVLDRALPKNTKLHAFGVKASSLAYIASNPNLARRVLSVDSLAWDAAARAACRTGRTMEVRIAHLEHWMAQQEKQQSMRVPTPAADFNSRLNEVTLTVRNIVGRRLADQIMDDVTTYEDARVHLGYAACWADAYAAIHKLHAEIDEHEIEDWLEEMAM